MVCERDIRLDGGILQCQIDEDYPIMMLGGMAVGKMTLIAAMGIGRDGHKRMLGLSAGGTENQETVKELLTDLMSRGWHRM